ncbi:MAG TPA: methyltransferase domain-containing protein [Mycobacteriales bacterium]|nr:methyltransferase domain-containing protein [Mycobacteriales bacterium]
MNEQAVAFEALVDDYDAARPGYPDALFDALPPLEGARVLELGAGTGLQTPGLLARGAQVVSTDRGPRMLGRLHAKHPEVPVAVARAEQLPFADASFDGVCGAQMWHWVDVPAAAAEAARVLRPGGFLAVWWNDVAAQGEPWFEAQQARLEAAGTGYRRTYRDRDHAAELSAVFPSVRQWSGSWSRTLTWPTYERWLRSKSYVAALPDVEGFLAAERDSLAQAFPDGRIVEPFTVRLVLALSR